MKTLLLNCAILTGHGGFTYKPITVNEAKDLLVNGFESAIGHSATAQVLSTILEREIPVNRIQAKQQTGQTAIVFQMNRRIEEGKILNFQEIEDIGYTLNRLEKIS